MTKYPRGRDIAVNWTLDLGGRTVDLAACNLSFEYFTGAGSKTVPASEYTIENNILSWTFPAEEQTAYGVYGLRLTATTPDGEELLFRNAGAFEIIHGEVDDEDRVLPMESSVETEQEEPEEEEPEEETPIYVSTSPIHVEKIPLGSNLTLRWRLLTPGDFDFRLEDCTLNLYYAAAGSGFNIATDYSLSTENGYVLTWNFHAEEQIRFGLYSLLLDVRKDGVKIATLVKDDAFSLVHRKGSIFPDRILDFESVVTSIGGGALYSLIDVRNDGYSTVYRADGVTPAATGDLLIYDGALWHAIDAGSLPGLSALENELASLRVTTDGIFARVTDLEGDLGELWLTAREFGVRMSDAEGNIGQLTLTAREFGVRMSDAEGNIGQLSLTAQQFAVRMSDVEGNVGQLSLTAQQFGVRMSDIEGNVGELALTAEQFGVRMTDAEGNIGQLLLTADQFATRISDTEGNVSLLQQTATAITTRVSDAEGNISTLQQTATSLTSRIQSAEGSISTISQTAESIQLQVDNQAGDIATLQVSARGLTSRVADAEGNISILEQTASSLTSRITDAEGNISTIEQTASSLTTRIADAEGNISTLQQTATSLTSRITDAEGNVSLLQQTAASLTTRIGDAEGNISTLTQTVDGFETRVETVEGNMSSITQTVSGIEQRVQTAEGNITTLTTDVSGVTARVTTAEGNISQLRTDYNGIHASVETLSSNLSDYEGYVDGVLDGIQDQIDGAIDTWFYNGTPTLENLPASEWNTTALKDAHLGDVYYDNLTGYAYRFTKDGSTYLWTEITDSAVVDALARARNAQDTADHKRRVFLTTPYTPYDAGDLWVQGHTANNDGTIYRCVNSRASGDFVSTDWELASDLVNQDIMRANFDVLANAIIGTVAEYGSDGKITGETATQFAQTVSNISFSVTKVGSALLPTGIDIANQRITITTDNFFLKGNGVGSDTALQIVYRDNVPKISVANLDVAGLFTTQNWSDARLALYNEAVGAANTYADGVGEDAEEYADNAVSYFNTNVVAPLAGRVGATETDLTTLKAYRTAMLDNMTIIAGGLILSTEMELGTTVNDEWKVYSGISGIYDSTARGGGIAAWYGGPRVDHLANPSATEYAASLFRMDGSGYLASGQLQWGAEGELIIHGQSTENPITIENAVLSQGDLSVTISDLIALKSWFTVESWTDGNGTHYYLKLNSSGTGLEGFVSDGFISAGGLSSGGGSEGASLAAVWSSLKTNSDDYANEKINAYHIPIGSGLSVVNGLIVANNAGTVTSVKVGTTTYNPTDGVVSLPAYPTSLPASDVYSWAKAETKPSYAFSEITGTASTSQIPTLAISKISGLQTALDGKQPLDADLTAIAGLTGTSGFLKKTAANTWALDTNTYLTTSSAASTYVSGVALNGNYLRVTKNGADTDLTIPYATQAQIPNWAIRTAFDPNAVEHAIESNYGESGSTKTNVPSEFLYGSVLTLSARGFDSNLSAQFLWDVRHGTDYSGWLWFRTKDSSSGWRDWTKVYTELSLTKSVLTDLLESSNGYYVKKSGDTMTGGLNVTGQITPMSLEFRNMSSSAGNGGYIDFHFNNSSADFTSRIIESASGILSISGGLSLGTTLQLGDGVLSWDGSANAWKLTGNFYATGFISAGGVSSGGGTSGVDLTAVWNNLIANTGEGLNKKIHTAHLPTVTITGTNISGTATYSGTGGSASTLTMNLTAVDTTYSAGTGISLSGTTISLVSGVCTAGTYYKTTVDTYGRVTAGYYADLSAAINGDLNIGTSNPTDADYYIAQYAGGGTTTTSYHRRPHSALYNYIKSKLDSVYVPTTRTVNSKALSSNITLSLDDIADGSTRKLANYLPLSGDNAMTGVLHLKANMYEDSYSGALNMNNSDIYNVNSIYTADLSDSQAEGIHFYRTSTTVDTLRAASGVLYFAPNRTLGGTATEYTVLHSGNYTSYVNTTNFPGLAGVRSVSISGNFLCVNTNGTNANLTIPYADKAFLPYQSSILAFNPNAVTYTLESNYGESGSTRTNTPTGFLYGSVLTIGARGSLSSSLSSQFLWDVQHNTTNSGRLWFRTYDSANGWKEWTEIYTVQTLTKSVVTGLIGSTTYAPYNSAGYLPLSAGASYPLTGSLFICSGSDNKIILDNTDADTNYQGISFRQNGTEYGALGVFSVGSTTLQWVAGGIFNTIYHSGNSNKSNVAWTASGFFTPNHGTHLTVGPTTWTYRTVLSSSWTSATGDYLDIGVPSSGSGNPSVIRLLGNGNVGIGTTSPSQKLHVAGNILTTGVVAVGTGGIDSYLASDTASNIYLHTSSGVPLLCDGLVVRRGSSYATATLGSSTYPWGGVYTTTLTASGNGTFAGNVGIGTTSPTRNLDVIGVIQAGNATYKAVLEARPDGGGLSFWSDTTSSWHKGYIDASALIINTKNTGNVGIGITSPSFKLDVAGQSAAYGFTTEYTLQTSLSSAGWYKVFTALNTNATSQTVILQIRRNYHNSNNETYTVSVNVAYNGKVSFTQISGCANTQLIDKIRVDYVNSGTTTIAIHYTGSAANTIFVSGIGDGVFCAPTAVSSVNGTAVEFSLQPNGVASNSNIVATGAITAGSASDARLKTNIQSLSTEAAKRIVMALNPVTFTWNEKATELYDQYKGDDLGMIAQEVEPYLPQAVGTIFENYKRLDYTKVISPLVKVAQDHESRIRQLEAENRELRKRLNMN